MNKIAVTTASGNLGSAIVRRLKIEVGSSNIIGIARTPSKAGGLGVEIRKGDYNSYDEFSLALEGVTTLLLVSGMDHPEKRIQQHRNVIEAAKANGVKKIVYTSIMGAETGNAFSPVVASNRQTEKDIQNSGLEWAIGRNSLYIEPDLEYVENYIKDSGIINCANTGKCGYTSRDELAYAYYKLLTEDRLNRKAYNLLGVPITQQELVEAINEKFKTDLVFKNIPEQEYIKNRKADLGDFLGTIIGGIYEGIKTGEFDRESHFAEVAGRAHKSILEMIDLYLEGISG